MSVRLVSWSKVSCFWLVLLLVVAVLRVGAYGQSQPLTVAAAADLQPAMTDIATLFKAQGAGDVRFTFGASGNLFAQIANGAPFDVFLSADLDYPQALIKSGNAVTNSFAPFARGALALYIGRLRDDPGDQRGTVQPLLLPEIRRIAIANPKHAPYGRAAEQMLRKAGVYDAVSGKLVLGENVRQAFEFAESGNAEAALVSRPLAEAGAAPGAVWWELPLDSYPPLDQAAVITKHGEGNVNARKFVHFLLTPQARAILERHGFRRPSTEKMDGLK